jgi:hypothetical protein
MLLQTDFKENKKGKMFSTQRSPISKTALHFGQFLGFTTFLVTTTCVCMYVYEYGA